ncbi:MAG: prolipoprotein diacylglyceryl transferase [Planctomycetes bacterium]|nr:prolipoprotein diacylglyceryl transferase [Planctomycetota bacterium]
MHRILLKIPLHLVGLEDLPVFSYGFMLMLGFLFAILLTTRLARREGIKADAVYTISFYAIICGIVGSRALWVFLHGPKGMSLWEMVAVRNGGQVYYGGLALAIPVCLYVIWRKKLPVGRFADIFSPGLALGLAFGRVGCLLNGCCYGARCPVDAWYGITFPEQSPAAFQHNGLIDYLQNESLPVYPTQPMASLAGLLICVILLFALRHRRFPGQVMLLFLQLYAIARFVLEIFRDDTLPHWASGTFPGLKDGQIGALITFIIATVVMIILWRRPQPAEKK